MLRFKKNWERKTISTRVNRPWHEKVVKFIKPSHFLLKRAQSQWKQWNISCFSAWFQQQEEFNSTTEEMTLQQINYCLQKFYLSARTQDGTFYNKKSLTAIRAALDRNFCGILSKIKLLFGPLFIQPVWYILKHLFNDIYLAASRLGKYPPLLISTSVNNC